MEEVKEKEKLPEGWKKVRLGEVIEEIKRNSPKGSFPYIEIGDIDIETKKYSLKEKPSPERCIKVFQHEIIVSKVRPTRGAISLIKNRILFVSPAFFCFKSLINYKFVFFYLSRREFFNYLGTRETGTTYPSINDKDILSFNIFFPDSPEEQQKIAEILETIDNVIEKTDQIIEKYKRIKQGLMQELLTKGIDENGQIRSEKIHKFKNSPLGRIPEEWEVVELGEVGEIVSGSTPDTSNSEFWNGDIIWITPDDLSKLNTRYIYNSKRNITEKGLKNCSAELISPNSIVISSRAPIGYLAVSKVRFATNQGCKSIILNRNNDPDFFYYCLHMYIKKMISLGSGTTFSEISKSDLENMKICIPKLKSEQQRIASILSQIDEVIEKEQKYKQKLERIKRGLMEDLLTGKVRVNCLIEGKESEC